MLCAGAAVAGPVDPAPYDQVAQATRGEIRFDALPEQAYPGFNLDHGLAFDDGHIGEHFAGQAMDEITYLGNRFDSLSNPAPSAPLTLRMGPAGTNLSVSRHRVFDSNVLYPLGPLGQPHPQARGEGMAAFLFDQDICQFGLKVHTQYEDDLGTLAGHLGAVEVLFFGRDGALIDRHDLRLPAGISDLGFIRSAGAADIAGVQVLNLDPGGISIDDVVYGCAPFLG
ncbi:hypothetical protein ATO10_11182 [Actibacterium atlanticum]|uniref:Uncharacterized protein n=1 Tax=Actibacterium atlanticum TaxID=1461693 RepID=A0A058ZKY3_9RHOB|nr:hypothetical protein [Actibacterium atlanticum]KCV81471.1 hypothetical protein ATO10_11182 [Actibacterium atlanticum]